MLPIRVALTVGSSLYEQQCVGVRLRRVQLPALDRLEVLLPAATDFDSAPGEDCSLELDGGDGAATVFTGQLTGVQRGLQGLHLTAHNGGQLLARLRPLTAFEKLSVGDIVKQLCGDAEVTLAQCVDGPTLALHVLEGRGTAAEEIARLASWAGARGAFDGDGQLHVTEEGGPAGELALRYGRELTAVDARVSRDPGVTFTVVGEGAGDPSSAEGRWVVTDFLKGSSAGGGSAATVRRVAIPALRSSDDASFAGNALAQRQAAAGVPVRLRLWLHPQLAPGMRLELADLPDGIGVDECRVQQVVSTLRPGRPAMTEIWATAQAGTASLFGDLAGLAGGLL